MATITSANAKLALAVTGVFPIPQVIEGWAADDAFSSGSLNTAETVKGVDGQFHAGYVFDIYKMTLTIMPDSPSILLMDAWNTFEKTAREKFSGSGTIVMPSVNRSYVLSQGYLKSITPFSDAKKVLQAMKYEIEWGDIQMVPLA
jgi:hypothetical protein